MKLVLFFSGVLFSLNSFECFYFPGSIGPRSYLPGEKIELKVNRLTSTKTLLGFDYYDLPVCKPFEIIQDDLSLGEILIGNKIQNTPYELKLYHEESCKILCKRQVYNKNDVEKFIDKIDHDYTINVLVDGLAAATRLFVQEDDYIHSWLTYDHGYRIGDTIQTSRLDDGGREYYLNNHIRITVLFHQPSLDSQDAHIVGLEVEPFSINHEADLKKEKIQGDDYSLPAVLCQIKVNHAFANNNAQKIDPNSDNNPVIWTYDIQWERSDIKWTNRWDLYVDRSDEEISMMRFSFINSLAIVLFLSGLVSMILLRTLHLDLSPRIRANEAESKWKLLHGDVFRPPSMPMLFAVTVGSGIQLFGMVIVTLFIGTLGLISPGNRGMLVNIMLLSWTIMGPFAGYYSVKTLKMLQRVQGWYRSSLFTAIFYPGIFFVLHFILNVIIVAERSTNNIPLETELVVLALWLLVSVPLTFLGGYLGFKQDVVEFPVKIHDIPRRIPSPKWYEFRYTIVLAGVVLPFAVIFVELFHILSSLWLGKFNHSSYPLLALVLSIFLLTSFEISIIFCYYQLSQEDHRWWWRSMFTTGSSAIYVFLYSLVFYNTKIGDTKMLSLVFFIGYTTIFSLMFFLGTAVVGYFTCFWFVWKIFEQPVNRRKLNETALFPSHESRSSVNNTVSKND